MLNREIVRMKFGSHLYGTSTPQSDTDFKAVFLPDRDSILLQRAPRHGSNQKKRAEGIRNNAEDIDIESFSLQEYLKLLAEGQTVAIDMLFAPSWAMQGKPASIWYYIYDNRFSILNRKAASFLGYCRQQANKYGIKGSRVAAARKTEEFLSKTEAKVGSHLKLHEIKAELDLFLEANKENEHIGVINLPSNNRPELVPHLECCNRKVPFFASIKQAREIYGRIVKEYGDRSLLAEKNEGVDWKALSHAVRVGYEALELLTTGKVTFPRPEREHLLDIKLGRLQYIVVADEIENLLKDVEEAEKTCTILRGSSDQEFIDSIILSQHCSVISNNF